MEVPAAIHVDGFKFDDYKQIVCGNAFRSALRDSIHGIMDTRRAESKYDRFPAEKYKTSEENNKSASQRGKKSDSKSSKSKSKKKTETDGDKDSDDEQPADSDEEEQPKKKSKKDKEKEKDESDSGSNSGKKDKDKDKKEKKITKKNFTPERDALWTVFYIILRTAKELRSLQLTGKFTLKDIEAKAALRNDSGELVFKIPALMALLKFAEANKMESDEYDHKLDINALFSKFKLVGPADGKAFRQLADILDLYFFVSVQNAACRMWNMEDCKYEINDALAGLDKYRGGDMSVVDDILKFLDTMEEHNSKDRAEKKKENEKKKEKEKNKKKKSDSDDESDKGKKKKKKADSDDESDKGKKKKKKADSDDETEKPEKPKKEKEKEKDADSDKPEKKKSETETDKLEKPKKETDSEKPEKPKKDAETDKPEKEKEKPKKKKDSDSDSE